MNTLIDALTRFFHGMLLGCSLLVIAIAGIFSFGYIQKRTVSIPFVIRGWFTDENGLPAVNVQLNGWGILGCIAVVALVYLVASRRSGE